MPIRPELFVTIVTIFHIIYIYYYFYIYTYIYIYIISYPNLKKKETIYSIEREISKKNKKTILKKEKNFKIN